MNFDDVLIPTEHVSRSYNDTHYVDAQTVLRCHTSAHQAEILRKGYTHFLVTGDVRCILLTQLITLYSIRWKVFKCFLLMSVEASVMDATSYAAGDLKNCLGGLTLIWCCGHGLGELVGGSGLWSDRAVDIKEKW